MDGFEKIDLNSSEQELKTSQKPLNNLNLKMAKSKKSIFGRKKTIVALVIVAMLFTFSLFGIVLPAQKTYKTAQKTIAQAKLAEDAMKKQNIDLAFKELATTKVDLTETQNSLNSMNYLGYIPGLNFYYSDANHLIKAGFYGLDAANILVDSIKPYADVLGFKGKGSFVGGTAEQRIQTAVTTMGKITPRIDDIVSKLELAKGEIDKVDPNRYPTFLIGKKVKDNLTSARKLTDDGVNFANEAKPLIKVLPQLLGEPKEKKYLVLFQNDKEIRPTGGFLTAYAIFRIDHGVIHVDSSSDIYDLDATISNKSRAPQPILDYLPKVPLFNLRDSNLSPDFVASMGTFNNMYKRSSGPTVDGIIAVDTQALVSAMNILGDVDAGGTHFTTKINPTCNCPQVIYDLEVYADQPVEGVKQNRKGIIGELMYAIMNKAFSSSPKLYWGPLFQEMLNQTTQKHLLFYVYDQGGQAGIESLNGAGRIKPFEGDYLHINEANFGGAKSNMFVSESVTQNYETKSDGSIIKTVTVDYRNPFPPSDCNLERGNLCLNAVLRDWFRIYVPKGSQLVSSQGSEVKMTTSQDLGKTVFEGFLTVRPQGVVKLTVSYQLPFKLDKGSSLPLLIQKQPGTSGFDYLITSQGRQLSKFKLTTDKELKLSL